MVRTAVHASSVAGRAHAGHCICGKICASCLKFAGLPAHVCMRTLVRSGCMHTKRAHIHPNSCAHTHTHTLPAHHIFNSHFTSILHTHAHTHTHMRMRMHICKT